MLEKDLFVKVCGITRQEDADLVADLGADLVGFIFDKKSPRYVTPQQVADIKTPRLMRTGVFTHHTIEEVRTIMREARLDLVQLHGGQTVAYCEEIGRTRVMKVFWPERYESRLQLEEDMERYAHCSRFFLFDAGTSGGGHGIDQNWTFLAGTKGIKTWFVAGGLGPTTIRKALLACNPCGVDLNSGVEKEPGIKDAEKLRAVFATMNDKLIA